MVSRNQLFISWHFKRLTTDYDYLEVMSWERLLIALKYVYNCEARYLEKIQIRFHGKMRESVTKRKVISIFTNLGCVYINENPAKLNTESQTDQ